MHELSPNKNPKNLVSFDKYKAYKETSLLQLQAILRNNSANLKLRLKSYEVGGSLYQGTGYSHLTFPEVTFIEKLIKQKKQEAILAQTDEKIPDRARQNFWKVSKFVAIGITAFMGLNTFLTQGSFDTSQLDGVTAKNKALLASSPVVHEMISHKIKDEVGINVYKATNPLQRLQEKLAKRFGK